MFKILITDKLSQAGLEKLKQATDVAFTVATELSPAELKATIPEFDALIVRSSTEVTADLLEAAAKLKVIGRAGIGIDNIDVLAASMRGIMVMNTPQANGISAAEQTLGLMLAVSRQTVPAHTSLLSGEWERSQFIGVQLHGKTLGLIGFGKIGQLVAQRAQTFGMDVIAYDPFVSEEIGREFDVTLVDFEDILAQADFISLHTALSAETHHLINTESIAQMKDGVILINTARGKLIDEAALAHALESGKVKAAAVDVYSSEPPSDNPLIGLPNVLHTPHLGASTVDAQREVAVQIVGQVLDALRGEDFRNAVNLPFGGPRYEAIRPYIKLAEKLGSLHCHLAGGEIRRVEIEIHGDDEGNLIKPVAAGLLKGILQRSSEEEVNYINAPILAEQKGVVVSQTKGLVPIDYPNLISCKVQFDGGEQLLAGVLFGGSEPRLVQVNDYAMEAKPEGNVLVLKNKDVPGVIGQVGTILSAYEVNIGEWRMGRNEPGGEALSFINVDSHPPTAVVDMLEKIPAITQVRLISL